MHSVHSVASITRIKPANDYHQPDWIFPPDGKVVALGYEDTKTLEATFGRRVHFWQAAAINRKQDIPTNTVAIFVHHRVPRDVGEYRRICDCARAVGVPVFQSPNNNDLGGELRKILKGADLAHDPDIPADSHPALPVHAAETAPPEATPVVFGRGKVKAFFRQHVNRNADKGSETERIRKLILVVHQHEMSSAAAWQQIYSVWKTDQVAGSDSLTRRDRAVYSRFQAGTIKATVEKLKIAVDRYVTTINQELDGIAQLAEQLDSHSQTLASELEDARRQNARLQTQINGFEDVRRAFEKINKK